jgi:hypothetical protein
VSLPVVALVFVAAWGVSSRRDVLAGLLLGTAAAIKPQIALPFFLYYVFLGRWRTFGVAVATASLLTFVAIAPMQVRGYPWFEDWTRNIAIGNDAGGPNDPTPSGPWRYQMIHLKLWLWTMLDSRAAVTVTVVVLCGLLAGGYIAMLWRVRSRVLGQAGDLLPLAALCALTLLPVYHKLYDAVLLVPVLAWAICAVGGLYRPVAIATLLVLSVFLVPFDFFRVLMSRTGALNELASTRLFQAVVFPHHAIATFATGLCMMYAFWRGADAVERSPVWATDPQLPGLAASDTSPAAATE